MKKIPLILLFVSTVFGSGNIEISDGRLKVESPDGVDIIQLWRDNDSAFIDWTAGTLFMTGGPINWGGLDFLNVGNISGDDIDISAGTGDYTSTGIMSSSTITDTVATLTGGNLTDMGNITGTDVDIAAGTGDIDTSGTAAVGRLIAGGASGGSSGSGNDFSGDVNTQGLYNFDSGALTTDSSGNGNTLVQDGPMTSNLVDFKQGDGSVVGVASPRTAQHIADASLNADFPLKSGDTNKKISIAAWVNFDTTTIVGSRDMFFSKATFSGTPDASFECGLFNDSGTPRLYFAIGHNSGASQEIVFDTNITVVVGRWYHYAVTFQDSDKSYKLRLWDEFNTTVHETTGNTTNNIWINSQQWTVNGDAFSPPVGGQGLDINIDEWVVFNDILTSDEIDEIRNGIFGVTGTSAIHLFTDGEVTPVSVTDSADNILVAGDAEVQGDSYVAGTLTATTITDTVLTITGGNITAMGNITGSDVDILAGTGDYTTSGIGTFGEIIDNGDLTFIGAGSGLPYADMHAIDSSTVTTITTAGVAVQVTIFDTNGPSNLATPDHTNDHITIIKDGDYKINVTATVNSVAGSGSRFQMNCQKNNGASVLGGLHVDRSLAGGGVSSGSASMTAIVTLADGDTVEVWIENETNTQNYVVEDIDINLIQIGG